MSEGRLADVVLLDDQHLEVLVQSKLYVHELMGMVASHCNLRREKHYFGLSFRDETGHYQWLQLDKHILDHEFPKKSGTITLYFQVKFYIESILLLMERTTVILLYMQSKQLLCKGLIETDCETIFELSAYILQISHGDYQDDTISRNNLKNFQLPRKILEENPSISFCEDQIISFYKRLCGLTSGSAIINYMSIVESLPTYGIHYYGVKDKSGIPWWIGVGVRGIAVFDHTDKKLPRKFFPWKSLENLFFRDRKFTIEVSEPKSSSKKSTWNHKLNSSSEDPTVSIVAHVWITPSTNLARSIWSMAVNQHQFYLDRKHFKNHTSCPWNVEDLRFELDNNINNSYTTHDVMNSSISAPNLMIGELRNQSSQRNLESSKLFEGLKSRKKFLEEKLRNKLEELKELCLKEAELTGSTPEDLLRFFKADEIPQTRRRVGTSFMLSSKLLDNDLSQADDLTQLEVCYEVEEKLMAAIWKLAKDKNKSKNIRKKMRQDFHEKQIKLKELEERINELRLKKGKELLHARSLEDVDDSSIKFESLKKHAFHSSHSQNEDPDKSSTYSSISNKSSSSTTSIPDQQQQQSPSSGIKFYPKKKLSDSSLSQNKLQHSNSNRSSRSNKCSTPDGRRKPPAEKSDRREKTPGRVEGRRKSNHFAVRNTTAEGDVTCNNNNNNSQFIGSCSNDEWKSKYSSLDRRRKSSGMLKDKKQQQQEEQEEEGMRRRRRRGSMELPQLTPSKYGSKRDSTLEDDDDDDYDDNDDDDDDTLGKHDASISSSTCHYLPNSCQFLQPRLQSSILVENSDSGIGNSTGLLGSCEENVQNVESSCRQRMHFEKFFFPSAPYHPSKHPPSCAESTSSGSSGSLHFRPPLPSRFESIPSGPDKLTRVITDVRVVGPRPPVGPSSRNQRNEEAVDALFKHYEEKILPSRMTFARDSNVGADNDANKNQSSKFAKPKDYLTSPRTKNKNRGFAGRAEFDANKFLGTSISTLPKIKKQTFRFCSTLV